MFLKKLFGKSENPESPPSTETKLKPPVGHPGGLTEADKAKCPFMNKNKDKQEKPAGGCPFMNTSDDQKNPGLQIYDQAYDQDHVSKFRFYLSRAKLDFTSIDGKPRTNKSRVVFDSYPIYLQHTLFYSSEDLQKIRTFECCSRFMAYEELRERGNKEYNQGKYSSSLEYYERALSLFKWLEHKEPEAVPIASTEELCSRSEIDVSESEASRSKIEFNMEGNTPEEENLLKTNPLNRSKENDEFRLKYKQFFVFYCDQNTHLHDGEEMTETPDIDMRKSLMVQVLMNMAAAYIKLNHFKLAVQCCVDAESLTNKVSQILLRKAQALALNRSASREELDEALKLIDRAIQQKPHQKIFMNVNKNILKMLNLHDVDEAYEKCRGIIVERIKDLDAQVNQHKTSVFDRLAEIHRIEQEILSSGRQPTERIQNNRADETVEFRIIRRMRDKYLRVVDFYTESDKPDQVKAAKHELQEVLKVINTMKIIYSLNLDDVPADLEVGDRASEKVIKRLEKVKTDFGDRIYNQGRYNFQMLEWAIKEIVEEDHKKEEAEKKRKDEEQAQNAPVSEHVKPNPLKYLWLLLILPLLGMIVSRVLF